MDSSAKKASAKGGQQDDLQLTTLQAENAALQKEIEELKQQLAQAEEESPEHLKELAARAQADLQNAKERLQREGQEIRKFAVQGAIERLLPTIDNFQRAFDHLPEDLKDNEWVKGVQAVEQELIRHLSEMGLQKMECVGQAADPARHEVLQAGPGEEGIVVEVFEDGYVLHEKVLRPAKVKVGNGQE